MRSKNNRKRDKSNYEGWRRETEGKQPRKLDRVRERKIRSKRERTRKLWYAAVRQKKGQGEGQRNKERGAESRTYIEQEKRYKKQDIQRERKGTGRKNRIRERAADQDKEMKNATKWLCRTMKEGHRALQRTEKNK